MTTTTNTYVWSTPHYGISHLSPNGSYNTWWATVTEYEAFADVALWFPGCGFSPIHETYPSLSEAKARGEQWVSERR